MGIYVNIWRAGVGEPLFVITGWNGTFRANRDMLVAFSSHFDVYGIELPGTGQSDVPLRSWSFHDFTSLIDAVFSYYRVEKGLVLGHSFGCVTALMLARYFPKRVSYLIISNTPILSKKKFWGAGIVFSLLFLLFTTFIAWPCSLILKTMPRNSGSVPGLIRRFGEQYPYLTRSHGVMRKILSRCIVDCDTIGDARNVKVPALIVGSEKGGITPLSNSLTLHKALGGSALVVIPKAPHDFTGVWAQKFSEIVRDLVTLKKP